ncbi:hypothetical protein H4R18_001173 [Coemansia javaensis]|uniref:Uncharacterized protein n=1 Tax=Coemansia javaensis TaxID=2761396 RepID=A0A9W8LM01_9FUNG|nr:hypothetical protein H4R18_001173 [Coemansia javaensis]
MVAVQTFKSIFPDVEVPLADLPTFWFEQMRQIDDFARSDRPRPVFVDEGGTPLYLAQIEALVRRLASGLYHDVGVRRGSVVAVVLPNTIYYLAVTLAVHMLGATCMPVNPAYTAGELGGQLAAAAVRFVLAAAAVRPMVEDAMARAALSARDHLVLVSDPDDAAAHGGVRTMHGILRDALFPRHQPRTLEALRGAVAFICYSGGTTGLSKAAMLSHYNIVANIMQGRRAQSQFRPASGLPRTSLVVLPMFHSFGLVLAAHSLPLCGSSLVVARGFSAEKFLSLVERHRVTDTQLVAPAINAISRLPPSAAALATLEWIVSGAAPLSTSVIERLESAFPGTKVMKGYGLTETSPGVSLNIPGYRNTESSGYLLPSIEAKVVDDNGRMLGAGEVGELCFRGPNVMLGYLGQPEATRDAIDADGFLHTGDIGYITTHVFVTDRKKELIKFNGFQIAPAELETLLMQHPHVADCAVVGIFDEKRQTEVPRAFVVLDAPADGDARLAESIADWFNERVAYYKRLRGGCVAVRSIPKSPAGKILRRMLRAPAPVPAKL